MKQKRGGYNIDMFPNLKYDCFNCLICSCIAKQPRECNQCGFIYCASCIEDWFKKEKICPNKCKGQINPLMSKALIKLYNNLDIKCQRCNKIVKLLQLLKHEDQCFKIKQNNENKNENFVVSMNTKIKNNSLNNSQIHKFRWSKEMCGSHMQVINDGSEVMFSGSAYETILAQQPLTSGHHYWEIEISDKTRIGFFAGVAITKNINFNTDLYSSNSGYLSYNPGLQKNKNINYNKKVKVGFLLNMNKGILSLFVNGKYQQDIIQTRKLKQGPIYPSVCFLGRGSCTIIGPLLCPSIFDQ